MTWIDLILEECALSDELALARWADDGGRV